MAEQKEAVFSWSFLFLASTRTPLVTGYHPRLDKNLPGWQVLSVQGGEGQFFGFSSNGRGRYGREQEDEGKLYHR